VTGPHPNKKCYQMSTKGFIVSEVTSELEQTIGPHPQNMKKKKIRNETYNKITDMPLLFNLPP
jgi:aromatic ring-cleaving dioxygenase